MMIKAAQSKVPNAVTTSGFLITRLGTRLGGGLGSGSEILQFVKMLAASPRPRPSCTEPVHQNVQIRGHGSLFAPACETQ